MTQSQQDSHWPRLPFGIVGLAILLRVAAMLALSTWNFDPLDNHWAAGWETGRIANHLAEGRGYSMELGRGWTELSPTAWLAPLYPTLVGAVFALFGSFTQVSLVLVLLFQVLCDGATCIVLIRLGERLGLRRAGLLAGLLFALSPSGINMSVRVLWCTSLLTLLCALILLRMVGHAQCEARHPWKSWVATGVLIGVTLLTSPTPALFIGLASLLLIARKPGLHLRSVSTMALAACLTVAPWIVRNHGELDAWFFIKSNIGNELFIGNNPIADGSHHGPHAMAREVLSPEDFAALAPLNEVERADRLGEHAAGWIRAHPAEFGRLTLGRLWTYWTSPFLGQWELLPLGPLKPVAPVAYSIGRWTILVSAVLGALLLVRRRRDGLFVLAFLALFPLAYYVTHAGIARYRFPVMPCLLLCASVTLDSLLSRKRGAPEGTPHDPSSIP